MFYIKKQENQPVVFANAVCDLQNDYSKLQGDNRKTVTALLLKEQNGLCAICERKADDFGSTIEHFLPQSIFPHLQLDYHNLYVACQACNGVKGNYLIPNYIFDPRFNPFDDNLEKGLKPRYNLITNDCFVIIPTASETSMKPRQPVHHAAYILQSTLNLLNQNRYSEEEKYPAINSLRLQRAAVWKQIQSLLLPLSKTKAQEKYANLKAKYENSEECPAYLSLMVQLFKQKLKL